MMIAVSEAEVVSRSSRMSEELWESIERFCVWLSASGGVSYDPYDLLGTRYGRWSRRLYYAKNPLGIALNAPLILAEIVAPQIRALFLKKARFATADAQLALGFVNLHEASQRRPKDAISVHDDSGSWLSRTKELANGLLQQSIPGYSGFCWGYPFDWQNVNGLMPKGTPHITATPYCYEVFVRLFDVTGDEQYLKVARSIAEFVSNDLKDTETGEDAAASSYTPYDRGKVVNASAYRSFVLFDAAHRFGESSYWDKAWKNLRFILQSQDRNSSWLYAIDNPPEAFIDHFHTCFVLKNLYKLNRYVQSDDVMQAVRTGYRYYRDHLFDGDKPKLYAIAPRVQIVQLEMYNVAEAITLGALLRHEIPEAFELAQKLAARLITQYQLPAGYWVTRVYLGGIRHTVPFLRWPQSQLFYALTNLLVAVESPQKC